jgi:hypothetical protein
MELQHPTFLDIRQTIPDNDDETVRTWVAAGWREVDVSPAPEPNDTQANTAPVIPDANQPSDTIEVGTLTGDDQAAETTPEPPAGTQE